MDEIQVEAMTSAFEDQLSAVYPNGPPNLFDGNDNLPREFFQKVVHDFDFPVEYEQFKSAFSTATKRWKITFPLNSNASDGAANDINSKGILVPLNTKPTGGSFSLFDQFQKGFVLTVEEIQKTSSIEGRLTLFEKVAYIDDLIMDWKEISNFLYADLAESSSRPDPQLALRIIGLHRKWYDLGRSSDEYTPLLFNICENLLRLLLKKESMERQQNDDTHILSDNNSSDEVLVGALVQNWRDMWLDLMQRNQYYEYLAQDIEQLMFMIFLQSPRTDEIALAQKILAMIDPNARWYHSWTNHVVTNDHLLSLLLARKDGVLTALSELWLRIQLPLPESDKNPSNYALQLHSISIFSITLCRIRLLRLIPWVNFNEENATKGVATTIDEMLDSFLRVIVSLHECSTASSSNCSGELKITVLNGVESILEGTRYSYKSDFDQRCHKVRFALRHIEVMKSFVNRCSNVGEN